MGDDVKAADFFTRGYANAQQPFQVWTETPRGGTVNFITGAGGFLQSVIFGYGGVRIQQDGLLLAPSAPPAGTDSVKLVGVKYRGVSLDIEIDARHIVVAATGVGAGAGAATATGAGAGAGSVLELVNAATGAVVAVLTASPTKVARGARFRIVQQKQ